MKLVGLFMNSVQRVWIVLYILCLWVADQKSIISTFRKWRIFAWRKDGGLRQDSTSAYSEMPGELDKVIEEKKNVKKKDPLDVDSLRGFGL